MERGYETCQTPVSLNMMHLWSNLCALQISTCNSSYHCLLFISVAAVPGALWAGAITPVATLASRELTLQIPSFDNVSLVKEYPSEIGNQGPVLRDMKGIFSYNAALTYLGLLLSSAASATTVDRSQRQPAKFDNSQFTYTGRSYGVGASVGLGDELIQDDGLWISYSYTEYGYEAVVNCIYNQSSQFELVADSGEFLYAAARMLPDSAPNSPEYSVYIGHGTSAIVAIGVAHSLSSERRYAVLTAGSSYDFLDKIQCTIDFNPTSFNVSVELVHKTITVQRATDAPDIDLAQSLRKTSMRQLELISNDETNLYASLVGDALNSSIANYQSSISSPGGKSSTSREAALAGVTNSFTAMVDDILMCYAAAQFMIGGERKQVTATVKVNAFRFGQGIYIYCTFAINTFVVLCVVTEALRTWWWRSMLTFNYLDPRYLVVAASKGGPDVSISASQTVVSARKDMSSDAWMSKVGRMRVILLDETHPALVLANHPQRDDLGGTDFGGYHQR